MNETPMISYMGIPGLKKNKMTGIRFNAYRRDANTIIKLVYDKYGVTQKQIKSTSRERKLVYPRHIIMYLLQKYSKMSLKCIGEIFNRDHTTVMHARTSIQNLMETDGIIRNEVSDLEDLIMQ